MKGPEGASRGRGRRGLVLAGILAASVGLLAAGCGSPGGSHVAAQAGEQRTATPTAATAAGSPGTRSPGTEATPGVTPAAGEPTVIPVPLPAGRLHQTRTLPSAQTRIFRAEMTDLWAAVVTGRASLATQAFFPLVAYTQVKAIADPASDWHARLFGDFRLDVAAAHRFLGRGARHDTLVRVVVPAAGAAWINPGVCYNVVGYWHVGGARLVYTQHGRHHVQQRSIGIASLISWRGRWYVVHFGAVLRTGASGVVDAPTTGPGIPGPAGGC